MYDGRFSHMRDKQGNLLKYCPHSLVIYPVFITSEELFAGFIPESCKRFERFTGICQLCGETITIFADDVVPNEKAFNKKIEEILKEPRD